MFLMLANISDACTNFLITKGATTDGSNFITYAADSHSLYGELYYFSSQYYNDKDSLNVFDWDTGKYLGKIKQVKSTYKVIGNMNEHQLAIGETTYGGRKELRSKTGKVDYGSLIYITLQRSKTAREAIKVMTDLVAEYGYYSSGESFSIADKNEVWILEMIGKGEEKGAVWVARKIPDGYVSAHANQARITTFPLNDKENCLYAKDVISFARAKGYFKGKDKDFSFSDVYAPVKFGGARFCESRVWSFFRQVNSNMEQHFDYIYGNVKYGGDNNFAINRMPLWVKAEKKISVKDVMNFMRDHFEGTKLDMTKDIGAGDFELPYRWRPLVWEVDGEKYCNERATATQQTAFSFVAQLRSELPNAIGGVLWFGVDDSYSTVYVPMYCSIDKVPYNFAVGTGSFNEFSWESAFWVFNFVSNYAYSKYNYMIKDIQKLQTELEGNFIYKQKEVESAAFTLYKQSPRLAKDYLTKYSNEQAGKTVKKWKKLGEFLIFKYLDGNVKDEYKKPTHPGYSKDFYKKLIKETGNHFKMK